jgi:hypothetical protein
MEVMGDEARKENEHRSSNHPTHAGGMTREFMVWAAMPPRTWIRLPQSVAGEIPLRGPIELWLQHDGCCSQASQAEIEVVSSCDVFMTRGWGAIARAYNPEEGPTLHFKYDGASTLFFKVLKEDGRRLECCPREGDQDGDPLIDRRIGEAPRGELALGDGRDASSGGGSSSGKSTSDDDYDEPPRCWARTEEGDEPPRHRAPMK